MSRPITLVTPIPSAEKVAARLGISGVRRKFLFDLVDNLHRDTSPRQVKAKGPKSAASAVKGKAKGAKSKKAGIRARIAR